MRDVASFNKEAEAACVFFRKECAKIFPNYNYTIELNHKDDLESIDICYNVEGIGGNFNMTLAKYTALKKYDVATFERIVTLIIQEIQRTIESKEWQEKQKFKII